MLLWLLFYGTALGVGVFGGGNTVRKTMATVAVVATLGLWPRTVLYDIAGLGTNYGDAPPFFVPLILAGYAAWFLIPYLPAVWMANKSTDLRGHAIVLGSAGVVAAVSVSALGSGGNVAVLLVSRVTGPVASAVVWRRLSGLGAWAPVFRGCNSQHESAPTVT